MRGGAEFSGYIDGETELIVDHMFRMKIKIARLNRIDRLEGHYRDRSVIRAKVIHIDPRSS